MLNKTISCIPGQGWHAYQDAFYSALSSYGFTVEREMHFSNKALSNNQSQILHFHWIERLWESPTYIKRIKNILGVRQYLKLAKKLKKKIVWTVHNHYPHENGSWLHGFGLRLFAKYSDVIICHSQWSKDWIESHFKVRGSIVVMPHGNFENVFSFRPTDVNTRKQYGLASNKVTLGMVGVIRENRGYEHALSLIKKLGDSFQLLIIGRCTNNVYLQTLKECIAGQLNVSIIVKNLSDAEYNSAVASIDLMLQPYSSITTSGALLSSWTIGTPTATSALPFFKEFAPTQQNAGFYWSLDDPDEFIRKFSAFSKFPLAETREAARIESLKYNWDRIIIPVKDEFMRLLS